MTYFVGQIFTSTATVNGETFVETAEIVRLTASRIVFIWTVNGEIISELSYGFKKFASKFRIDNPIIVDTCGTIQNGKVQYV